MTTPHHYIPVVPGKTPDAVLQILAAPGPTGPGGMFFVDPERAQDCIDRLRKAVLDLGDSLSMLDLAYFPPPADDPVSVNLAVQGGVMAQRAQTYVVTWRDQLTQTAQALEEQLAAYRATDEANARRLA